MEIIALIVGGRRGFILRPTGVTLVAVSTLGMVFAIGITDIYTPMIVRPCIILSVPGNDRGSTSSLKFSQFTEELGGFGRFSIALELCIYEDCVCGIL